MLKEWVENYWVRYAIHNLRWVIIILLIFYSTAYDEHLVKAKEYQTALNELETGRNNTIK